MPAKRDFLSVTDLSPDETRRLIQRAARRKTNPPPPSHAPLTGKSIALLFEKPSLRTKVSFQVGIAQLGGYSLYLGADEVGLGGREPIPDIARVLSGYVDAIIARVFHHQHLQELAQHAAVPVINALSDHEHPCQILADLQTIYEHQNRLDGLTLAYIGDGNNVARSLCLALPAAGINFRCASPEGYQLDPAAIAAARQRGPGQVQTLRSPAQAVSGADLIYTDVWASMGQETEAARRRQQFAGYTVDPRLLSQANPGALFMHDMPAHYGEEVPPGMLEHPQSIAYPQARNRLHAQKALLEFLLSNDDQPPQ